VPEWTIMQTERPAVALTQVKLHTSLSSQYKQFVTLKEPQYLPESIVVEISKTEDLVKVVP
jgi:hypothetical protein